MLDRAFIAVPDGLALDASAVGGFILGIWMVQNPDDSALLHN
jgi:hypothetical protein